MSNVKLTTVFYNAEKSNGCIIHTPKTRCKKHEYELDRDDVFKTEVRMGHFEECYRCYVNEQIYCGMK